MKNLTEYNEFRNNKRGETTKNVNEGAQLFDDTWKVRTRVEIPTSLINAYVKKVEAETGEDPKKRWSEQEIAEELTKYVTSAFLTVENLPSSIISTAEKGPQVQTQEDMPEETQVEVQVDTEDSEVQVEIEREPQGQGGQPQGQGGQPQSQEVAQEVPQGQGGQSQEI
ncbi:MAG: hypothetical protein ACOCVF_03745 [bacterium]